jgi:tRNA (guanine-N7-)-methyltransferase
VGRKNKLKKFREIAEMENVIQPSFEEIYQKKHPLYGKWKSDFFGNENPIILELGCGKGEYTVGLASRFVDKNFLGVDIKGARIWGGANDAIKRGLKNVGFLRTRVEFIDSFFEQEEIEEIWITFPDPQLKKRRNKKRLTGSRFLNIYGDFLKPNGIIHLKTDNEALFDYTRRIAEYNDLPVLFETADLYSTEMKNGILSIKTYYEKQFLSKGMNIHYLKFCLPPNKIIQEIKDDE